MKLKLISDNLVNVNSTYYSGILPFGKVIGGTARTLHIHLINDTSKVVIDPALFLSGEDAYDVTRVWTGMLFTDAATCGIYFRPVSSYNLSDMDLWVKMISTSTEDAHEVPDEASSSTTSRLASDDYLDLYIRVLVPLGVERVLGLSLSVAYLN